MRLIEAELVFVRSVFVVAPFRIQLNAASLKH